MKNEKHISVVRLTSLALLAALIVVLQTVASGSMIGPVPSSLGWLFACFAGTVQFTNLLWVANPFCLTVICVGKAVLCGWVAGLVYRALEKRQTLGCIAAAICAPIVNTGVFAIGMLTVFKPILQDYAGGTDIVYYFFVFFIGVNFLVEFGVNTILSAAIARIVKAVEQSLGKKNQ